MFAYQLFKMQERSLSIINKKARESDNQFIKLKNIMENSSEAFNVGEQLLEKAKNNSGFAQSISEYLETMNENISELKVDADATTTASNKIGSSKDKVRNTMMTQTEAISAASTATEEISTQVHSITESAQNKKSMIDTLVSASTEGANKMEETARLYQKISSSSDDILEVTKVIEAITHRTNLLAMNAAIEAAHAGDAGRGFAVVAAEIRNLAEETNENSQVIKSTLEKNQALIDSSVKGSNQLQEVFGDIVGKISEVRQVLLEIIAGMEELSSGHSEILNSVTHLTTINGDVNDALESMESDIQTESESISHIHSAIKNIAAQIQEVTKLSGEIVKESGHLQNMGDENIKGVTELKNGLETVYENS
jgi:methyl-accepting chemotaxis protein